MMKNKKNRGFTLIEFMIVISIIGILSAMAIPPYLSWVQSSKVRVAVQFTEQLQDNINQFYRQMQYFPTDNQAAGLPDPKQLISPEIAAVNVENGALQITFRSAPYVNQGLADKQLSLRPVYVEGSPKTPVSWICGNTAIPEGMTAAGANRTSIAPALLPLTCRNLAGKGIALSAVETQEKPSKNHDKGGNDE